MVGGDGAGGDRAGRLLTTIFLRRPVTPLAAWRLEYRLARTLWGLGRRLVELAYNRVEPLEVKLLPTRLRVGLDEYRRNRRTPRDLFCLFGPIRLWRVVYQAVEPGTPGLFPLEQALGIVARLATPALADQVGRLMAELTQQQTQAVGTVYPGQMPELGQGTMTGQLTDLLHAVLEAWEGPLPRLHYVTDAGNHPLEFYHRVLRPMRHPRTGKRLEWTWSVDYFHAAERITKLAEVIFGVGQEASAWAAKMRKVLKERTNGVSRVLHSAGALRQRRGLSGSEKDYRQAVN